MANHGCHLDGGSVRSLDLISQKFSQSSHRFNLAARKWAADGSRALIPEAVGGRWLRDGGEVLSAEERARQVLREALERRSL